MNTEQTIKRTCGAKTDRGPCKKPPMKGRTRCDRHGGKSLAGAASPTFKHGRYSKHLPTNLIPSFQAALEDPDLLSLRSEIALTQCRIDQVIESAQGHAARLDWEALLTLMEGKRRLHESEAKRLQLMNQYVESERVVSLLSSFALHIKSLVENEYIPRANIIPQMQKFLSIMLYNKSET
jgi:hypothetical protein